MNLSEWNWHMSGTRVLRVIRLPLLLMTLVAIGQAVFWVSREKRPMPVSLIQLIAEPEQYDGVLITVSGFLHVKFEDCGLYFSREHADYFGGSSAIWVSYLGEFRPGEGPPNQDLDVLATMGQFDRKYVLVQGIFDADDHGHLNSFRGGIHDVSRVVVLENMYPGE